MDRTDQKIDTRVARASSGPVRWELIDKDGVPISLKSGETKTFSTVASAAEHARYLWPDQRYDEHHTGEGWTVRPVGAKVDYDDGDHGREGAQ